jgi:beta-1,4-mannosyl-glycoprotein beta-1,4-N-acetylglucosaminyltransferase
MKHKIFDCITFFRENEQFLLRFNILNKYVDYFVICEALQDHQGKKKKINFNFKPFLKFKKKIIYLILKEFPNEKNKPEVANGLFHLNRYTHSPRIKTPPQSSQEFNVTIN